MNTNEKNFFLKHLCEEVTTRIDSIQNQGNTLSADDFKELISNVAQELMDETFGNNVEYYKNILEYKAIASQSLESYSDTTKNIESIKRSQEDILNQSLNLIDSNEISSKLQNIQEMLNEEFIKANKTITELKTKIKDLEMQTSLDPLTKTYNRYALSEHLERFLQQETLDFDIFLIMIDVDDFKIINDTYGHIAGDKVLIFLSKLFKSALRDSDKVYRYGGEEFIAILNRTDIHGAIQAAQRLLTLCRTNKPLYKNKQIPITLSIGFTKLEPRDTLDEFIARADKALYRAKTTGKNKMEMELI